MSRKIIPAVVALLVVSYFGYRVWAERRAAARIEEYYGTVEATESVVSSQLTGRVVKIHTAEGQKVEAGDPLLELDDDLYRAQLEQARGARRVAAQQVEVADANLKALEINLRRARNLVADDAAPRSQKEDLEAKRQVLLAERQRAKSAVSQADATVIFMKRQLTYTQVSAPLSGTVLRLHVEIGETAFPGSALLTIGDLSSVQVRVYVPETMLDRIGLGQRVELFTDGDPERALPARVAYISDEAEFTPKNVQTREERVRLVYAVKLEAANPEGVLKIGMPVEARFIEE